MRTGEFKVHAGSLWPAFERTWLQVLNYTGPWDLVLEGKVVHHRQQGKGRDWRRQVHWQPKKKKYFGRQKLSTIPVQEFFLGRCGGKQLRAANEKSPNDYDEIRKRQHRELSNIISRTPQTTTSNSFLGFPVWSFPTSTEQIQKASSHHAFTVNNFHICQVTFSLIQKPAQPKSSDRHYYSSQ